MTGESGGLPALAAGRVDSHAHVFRADLRFAAGSRYVPDRDARAEDYLGVLDGAGIAAALLIQPSFLGLDNSYMLEAIAQAPQRFRGVAVVAPEISGDALAALAAAGIVGVRVNLIGLRLPDFDAAPWPDFLARVGAAGLHVEVQAEGDAWLALLPGLARLQAPLVIDHMGRVASTRTPEFRAILNAAARPGTWVKLSGPYRFAADAKDAAAALLDRAGAARLLWGSDWPWTQHPEIARYADTLAWLEHWVPDERRRRAILEHNPRRLMTGPHCQT
jgi:predicted TIM-barrel fold metal-dependent hydrolase